MDDSLEPWQRFALSECFLVHGLCEISVEASEVEQVQCTALVIYVMAVVVGERINVVIWTAAFIQSCHGHKHRLVKGICFL